MPTNLPPDYFTVEKRFRAADAIAEKISLLEEMMSLVPKHKGTDHLRADLRRKLVFENLDIIRVYTRAPGREPDFSRPFVLKKGGTIEDLSAQIHHDFVNNLKTARVWGKSVFDGQLVQRDFILSDGDIVELNI